jgi:hypothetical protein
VKENEIDEDRYKDAQHSRNHPVDSDTVFLCHSCLLSDEFGHKRGGGSDVSLQ